MNLRPSLMKIHNTRIIKDGGIKALQEEAKGQVVIFIRSWIRQKLKRNQKKSVFTNCSNQNLEGKPTTTTTPLK